MRIFVFFLLLTAILFNNSACKKNDTSSNKADSTIVIDSSKLLFNIYKDTLVGTYTWHHYTNFQHNAPNVHTEYPDTILSIIALNNETVYIGGKQLTYYDSFFYTATAGYLIDTAHTLNYCDRFALSYRSNLSFNRLNDSVKFSMTFDGSGHTEDTYYTKIVH